MLLVASLLVRGRESIVHILIGSTTLASTTLASTTLVFEYFVPLGRYPIKDLISLMGSEQLFVRTLGGFEIKLSTPLTGNTLVRGISLEEVTCTGSWTWFSFRFFECFDFVTSLEEFGRFLFICRRVGMTSSLGRLSSSLIVISQNSVGHESVGLKFISSKVVTSLCPSFSLTLLTFTEDGRYLVGTPSGLRIFLSGKFKSSLRRSLKEKQAQSRSEYLSKKYF